MIDKDKLILDSYKIEKTFLIKIAAPLPVETYIDATLAEYCYLDKMSEKNRKYVEFAHDIYDKYLRTYNLENFQLGYKLLLSYILKNYPKELSKADMYDILQTYGGKDSYPKEYMQELEEIYEKYCAQYSEKEREEYSDYLYGELFKAEDWLRNKHEQQKQSGKVILPND